MKNEKIFELALEFNKEFKRKNRYNLFSMQNVRETKWWKIFEKIILRFGEEKEWNAHQYIFFIFDIYDKKVYPHFLLYNKNWKDYVQHLEARQPNTGNVAKSLLVTFNEIKNWTKKNNYVSLNVKGFFEDKKNFLFLKRKKFSPYFLAISKSFNELYNSLPEEEKKEIISEYQLMIKKAIVLNDKRIKETLNRVLKEEFIGFY